MSALSILGSDAQQRVRALAVVAGVAAGSFALGRWSSQRGRKANAPERGKHSERAAVDQVLEEVKTQASTEELLRLLSQLEPKPLGQHTEPDNAPHSAAKAVLVCASGKGGVGKSTVSVNLAFMLKQLGVEVGLLDLDVYGPSLPSLVKLPAGPVMQNEHGRLIPLDYDGVALMSWGYIEPEKAATVRAPILNQMVTQLLTSVEWGLLDVLIIDSPPGTGDVLLSLGQTVPVDGAIIVTTSNLISLADVVKGVQLFEKIEIPPLLVVANMATFTCQSCGHEHALFADDAMSKLPSLLESKGVGLIKMPFDPVVSKAPRSPMPPQLYDYPFVRNPENDHRVAMAAFRRLAHAVLESLLGAGAAAGKENPAVRQASVTTLRIRAGGKLEVRLRNGDLKPVACGEVRAACRCAHCVDDMTGEVKIDRERIRADRSLQAKSIRPVGNYAVSVTFSDGHSTVIALRALEQMVGVSATKTATELM
jgi:Mrp family chromosome partitioning ATPase/DUF971 family protein